MFNEFGTLREIISSNTCAELTFDGDFVYISTPDSHFQFSTFFSETEIIKMLNSIFKVFFSCNKSTDLKHVYKIRA